jgi:hypothetical protein
MVMVRAIFIVLLGFVILAAVMHSGIAAFPLLLLIPLVIAAVYVMRHTRRGDQNRTPS